MEPAGIEPAQHYDRGCEPNGSGGEMSQPLIYVDRSKVRAGALTQLKSAIEELADFIEEHEPRLISYSAYFSADDSEMTVVHVHVDPSSLDHHMDVVGPRLERFADLLTLSSITIYGQPSARALAQLQDKIHLLGAGEVTVHLSHAGFSRASV
jgi:hypothetical protein